MHVVCARRRDCQREQQLNGVHIHRAGFDSLKEVAYYLSGSTHGRGRVGTGVHRPAGLMRVLTWVYNWVWKKIYFPDDAGLWYFPARQKVLHLLENQIFDAVITVSLPFTGHLIGRLVKRRFPGLRWLADIGDPFTIQAKPLNNPWLYGRLSERLEKAVLDWADAAVVTNAAARRAYETKFGPSIKPITVIPPLLHPPVSEKGMPFSVPLARDAGVKALHIGYFGAFYAPVRTPHAFLNLLNKTLARRPDWKSLLTVHIFGDIFPEFYTELAQYPNIKLYGLRSRQEVRSAIEQMDVLVNIGNVTDYQLPSKAVEYLAAGKPVVHLSFVEQDPFVAFWADWPGLLTLSVKDARVTDASFERWLGFVDAPPIVTLPEPLRSARLREFSVEAVAAQYAYLLGGEQPIPAKPATAAIPLDR